MAIPCRAPRARRPATDWSSAPAGRRCSSILSVLREDARGPVRDVRIVLSSLAVEEKREHDKAEGYGESASARKRSGIADGARKGPRSLAEAPQRRGEPSAARRRGGVLTRRGVGRIEFRGAFPRKEHRVCGRTIQHVGRGPIGAATAPVSSKGLDLELGARALYRVRRTGD